MPHNRRYPILSSAVPPATSTAMPYRVSALVNDA
jgi:hypothetical protein